MRNIHAMTLQKKRTRIWGFGLLAVGDTALDDARLLVALVARVMVMVVVMLGVAIAVGLCLLEESVLFISVELYPSFGHGGCVDV